MATAPSAYADSNNAGHCLNIKNVSHFYGQNAAVRDANLNIKAGELVSLLGPSGCGKTTLLRIIAGFIQPTQGDICIDEDSIRNVPPNRRKMGIVFQNYALFPHLTIFENVAYGLRANGVNKSEITSKVNEMLELVQLAHLSARFPSQLSGGQQQRIALARALATSPRILLLDEPLSALDKNLRLDMQIEIKRIQREFGITTIMVTHDQEEAMTMSDRICVINDGQIQQFDSPTSIYDSPANMFVNEFIGTTNVLKGQFIAKTQTGCRIKLDSGEEFDCHAKASFINGAAINLSARPEGLKIEAPNKGPINGVIDIAMPVGSSIIYDVKLTHGFAVKIEASRRDPIHQEGQQVSLSFIEGSTPSIFPAQQPQTEI